MLIFLSTYKSSSLCEVGVGMRPRRGWSAIYRFSGRAQRKMSKGVIVDAMAGFVTPPPDFEFGFESESANISSKLA